LYKIEEETPSAQIPLYNEILFPRSDYIIAKRSKVLRTAFSIYSLGDTMVNTHFLGDTMSFKDEWHVCIDKSCRKIRLDSGNFTAILPATMMTKIKIFKVRKIKINHSNSLDELGSINFKIFLYTIMSYIKLKKELLLFRPNKIYFEIAPKNTAFIRDSLYVLICKLFKKKIIFQTK